MQFKDNLPKKHAQQLIAVMYVRVNWNEVLFGSTQLMLSGKVRLFQFGRGGPDYPLTNPNFKTVRRVFSDGNCLFCSFLMIITGSQEGHLAVRIAILRHMQSIAHLLLGVHVTQNSIAEYVQDTHMDMDGAWGTEVETLT